jgi:hypothetical protein
MANPNEYIVFEPDQVLTNDHLNETFNYLDQQNRWTRNKLIGIGIVCGLDIVLNPGVIEITEGCGITSQGYLITQETASYTYYVPYTPVEIPVDLPFAHGPNLPFYKPFWTTKKVWKLITDDEYKALENDQQLTAVTISSATNFLHDYVVALFLEAKETDLKNCNMLDCNNTGATMDFTVRPLLVAIKDLPDVAAGSNGKAPANPNPNSLQPVSLKRFNVPYADLNDTNDVLNAFVNIVDDNTLTHLGKAYNDCFQQYGALVNVTANPFSNLLNNLKTYRNLVLTQNPVFIQYFYDFVDDLIKAYNEFSAKVSEIVGTCCPDENLFPLHLILGVASSATDPFSKDDYRDYFMYSELFSQMGNESSGAVLLFNRMVIMVNKFIVQSQALQLQAVIRITPSKYEYAWLSDRAIPYYYQVNASGAELYKYWNYYKTSHGNAALNLSYNANLYNTNTAVTQPLLYDIEQYNFFRIEGHIGQNYKSVLSNILGQRLNYNLPFDVVAVTADQLQADAPVPECAINDLETDYKLIISEASCKIHQVFCFISKLPYKAVADTSKRKAAGALFEVPKTKNLKYSAFRLQKEPMVPFIVTFTDTYQKGDYLRKYCPAVADTIGSAYLHALSGAGVFTNPVQIDTNNPLTIVYFYLFTFIDAVEELMYALQTNTLAQLDIDAFDTIYQAYIADTLLTFTILIELTIANTPKNSTPANADFVTLTEDTELDLLIDELGLLTNICVDDRLQVLKDEYTARLKQYQQQLVFLNYYKDHPGLEHKAGVPKGGTFVLVYHSEPVDTAVTVINTDRAKAAASSKSRMEMLPETISPAMSSYDDGTIKMIRKFVNDCHDAPAETKQKIIGLLGRRPTKKTPAYTIPDGAVIADFYIPYLCCSDCPPVAYVMPGTVTPAHPKPTVTMETTFCDSDTTPEKITVSEPGGSFNTVKGLDGSKLTFTPATAGAGDHHIVYTLNGVASDPVVVTVLQTPVSTFKFENMGETNANGVFLLKVTFTADRQDNGYSYKWTFGKGFPIKDATGPVQHLTVKLEAKSGQIATAVSLVVSNGNCHAKAVTTKMFISPNGVFHEKATNFIKGIENIFSKKKNK